MPDKSRTWHRTEKNAICYKAPCVCRAHPVSSGFYPVSLYGIFRGKCFLEPEVDAKDPRSYGSGGRRGVNIFRPLGEKKRCSTFRNFNWSVTEQITGWDLLCLFACICVLLLPLPSVPRGRTPIWNRRGCSSKILNLTPKGDHLGVAQAFCDP